MLVRHALVVLVRGCAWWLRGDVCSICCLNKYCANVERVLFWVGLGLRLALVALHTNKGFRRTMQEGYAAFSLATLSLSASQVRTNRSVSSAHSSGVSDCMTVTG